MKDGKTMTLGLFDAVGPIMHGPSANHTGGPNRISYMAYQIIGGTPKRFDFIVHPLALTTMSGQNTDTALLAGILGIREDDECSVNSKEIAKKQELEFDFVPLKDESLDRNTMQVSTEYDGLHWHISGIGVGGGNVVLNKLNGMDTDIDGGCYLYYFADKDLCNDTSIIRIHCEENHILYKNIYAGYWEGRKQLCLESDSLFSDNQLASLVKILLPTGTPEYERVAPPIRQFVPRVGRKPLFDSFEGLLAEAEKSSLLEAAYAYQISISGSEKSEIFDMAMKIVDVEEKSIRRGLEGNNPLLCGFTCGSDGKSVMNHVKSGETICGGTFPRALSYAISMAEVNASAGMVVGVPSNGSAGVLPGTLFAVAERYECSKEKLAEAFIVASIIGVLIGKHASFAGSVGGCQAEIGTGASMAAGAATWLANGTPEQCIHASALALKNCFGLACDIPASPVEVPCVKRNSMGASVALMGAELALAGVKSVIAMDEVVLAFADVQRRLPLDLKCNCVGGLASIPSAEKMRQQWEDILASKQNL